MNETNSEVKELNMEAKVTVRNLAGWDVSFTRMFDNPGTDVLIPAKGQHRMSRNEIQVQVDRGNKLFCGTDGSGSHATIYIDDADTRIHVGFETEDTPQAIFTHAMVKDLFKLTQKQFETALPEKIRTRAEKFALMEAIKALNLNDYRKIMFCVEYTGYQL